MKEVSRLALILFLICAVAAGLLAFANRITKNKILAQSQQQEIEALKEVLPQALRFEPILKDNAVFYYLGFANDELVGAGFSAKAKGYSSIITTMVGMLPDGTINMIKVLSANETPGLGTKISEVKSDTTLSDVLKGKKKSDNLKPWFQEQFFSKKISELDNINAISGATISSRAVINSVKEKALLVRKDLEVKNGKTS